MGVLEQLGIEWRMMVVNLVGFLILLALLKRFAFGPIGQVLGERASTVEATLDDAERAKQTALADRRSMDEQLARLDERADQIVSDAQKRAEDKRREILKHAEEQSHQILAEGERSVERAAEEARAQLRQETAEIAVGISERALRESLDEERQAALVDAFIADIERIAAEAQSGSAGQ
ncbi:MAG TPA: ATP synthase F0 subunit B [Armatimonadetes bacterium]|nr:ATP synthase F0 subunit B [Armatimonadota bacterium]